MELKQAAARALVAGALVACVAACGRGDARRGDSARAVTGSAGSPGSAGTTGAATGAPATTAERKPMCQRTGHWDSCLVKVRLEESGMVPQAGDPPTDLPQLGTAPVTYHIGRAAIALYIYPDTLARARAARSLDPAKFIAPSAPLTMKGEATAIQNDNLLALLFSLNDQQRERVSDAFMAGPPQR